MQNLDKDLPWELIASKLWKAFRKENDLAHFRYIPMNKYIKHITEAYEYQIYNIISHEIYVLIL